MAEPRLKDPLLVLMSGLKRERECLLPNVVLLLGGTRCREEGRPQLREARLSDGVWYKLGPCIKGSIVLDPLRVLV